jgi:hypothetical protein
MPIDGNEQGRFHLKILRIFSSLFILSRWNRWKFSSEAILISIWFDIFSI